MDIPENEDATTMVVALCFDVGISHQEHRENESDDIPSREDESEGGYQLVFREGVMEHT